MRFFVDTNVIVYTRSSSPYCDPCARLVAAVAAGEAEGFTSAAVLEELWHLELAERMNRLAGLAADAYETFRPVLAITDEVIARALATTDAQIGANDRVHVATCLESNIDTIVSADRGFDAIKQLRRIDPLDAPALAELVAHE